MTEAERFVEALERFVKSVVAEAAPGADVHEAVALIDARRNLLDFLEEPT